MPHSTFTLSTDHGTIFVVDTALKTTNPVLLLIHGNSSSSKIWRHILDSPKVNSQYRIIAFDLPGHGSSSDAPDPEKSYSMRGYADLAVHILQTLNVQEVVVFGWSLGGHIGIEMLPLLHGSTCVVKGLLIVGTPPALGLTQTDRGFTFTDGHMSLAAKRDLTDEEIDGFAHSTAGAPYEEWMEADVRRCDGRARFLMWKKFADGVGVDQVKVVQEEKRVLLGVVNGGAEPFVNLDYLEEIKWANLWKGKCLRLKDQGHAPFWERPDEFEHVLLEFVQDASKT